MNNRYKNVHALPGHTGHKAKKSLGQNFLKSEPALRKIIEAGEISKDDIILEIGPGKGALTKKLLEKAGFVVAIEKDRNLFQLLEEKFKQEIKDKKLILIEGDILEFNPSTISSIFSYLGQGHSIIAYKVIANIPYNITGAILKKFLTEQNQPSLMILMVQHEVAKRICVQARRGHSAKESILSVSVKAYGIPKIEMKVPARYFSPAPKVDSAIISIKNISRKLFTEKIKDEECPGKAWTLNEGKFWEVIHAGFAHKRKILFSNLKKTLKFDAQTEEKNKKILGKKRAEELSLEDWVLLTKNL